MGVGSCCGGWCGGLLCVFSGGWIKKRGLQKEMKILERHIKMLVLNNI